MEENENILYALYDAWFVVEYNILNMCLRCNFLLFKYFDLKKKKKSIVELFLFVAHVSDTKQVGVFGC